MCYERDYNTQVFNDRTQCPNHDCEDGEVMVWYTDDFGNEVPEKESCPVCDGEGTVED